MKKILYILALAGILASCRHPQKLAPSTTSLGLTSVSAMFNYGKYKGNSAATFTASITDLTKDIIIPVPWFYPEESDDVVIDITNMKVYATMDYNCFLYPSLGLLDLTKPNEFTYTDGRGEKHKICIRGEIRKLSGCNIISFSLSNPTATAVIDNVKNTITIPVASSADLSACVPQYSLSPHSTCSLDGLATVNFEKIKTVKVTAHDGTIKTYSIVKIEPPKINYGFRSGSEIKKWSVSESSIGIEWVSGKNVSLAVSGNYLVVNSGDGSVPVYVNRANGSKAGTIKIGSADASGCVKNDDAGNMIICNHSDTKFIIWKTQGVTNEPELLLSYDIKGGLPMGYKVAIQGNINSNALIVATVEGITEVSVSNNIVCWQITGGKVGEAKEITTKNVGATPGWGASPGANADVVPLSNNITDGLFASCYDSGYNNFYHIDGTSFEAKVLMGPQSDGSGWAYNNNAIDIKEFNKARYAVLLCTSHFPQWSIIPQLYMYDVTNIAAIAGTVDKTSVKVFSPKCGSFYNVGDGVGACADVILVPSTDGYILNLYYIEHNNSVIEAYEFDCIKK